ncbi:MAG: signal transduction histidine kinase [Rhodomicrobium sp.]
MIKVPEAQIGLLAKGAEGWENEGGSVIPWPAGFTVDDGPHNSDGLLLRGWNGAKPVKAFISRRVMDDWVDPGRSAKDRRSLFRDQYNALGKSNLPAIERLVTSKYQRGPAFNRQHPFVEVLLSDITESGEVLDVSSLEGPTNPKNLS